jgi:dipeptidyl aminopeptidase/acylaminoacyl peptidase
MWGWLVGVGIFIILMLGLSAVLWKMAVYSFNPKRIPVEKGPDVPYESVEFQSEGQCLKGWFIPGKQQKPGEKAPLIMLVHGWASGRPRMMRYVDPLYEAGYALFMFDVRSHGESDGVKSTNGKIFRDDILAAVDYVKQRADVDAERIGILGHSFGGFGSILAIPRGLDVKAIVADSSPARISTIMKAAMDRFKLPSFPLASILLEIGFYRAGIKRSERQEFDTVAALNARTQSVLLIHSKNDDYIPISEMNYMLDHMDDKTDYLVVDTEGHRGSHGDAKFWGKVLAFYEEKLI